MYYDKSRQNIVVVTGVQYLFRGLFLVLFFFFWPQSILSPASLSSCPSWFLVLLFKTPQSPLALFVLNLSHVRDGEKLLSLAFCFP